MKFLQRFGFYFLVLAVISELLLPFVLGRFIFGYDQIEMLISNFGENGMPTKLVFKLWEVFNGGLFILSAPAFYKRFCSMSHNLAIWVSVCIILFGIGDCIITGLVDRATTDEQIGFAGLLHNYASGVGFVALLIGTFILIWLYKLEQKWVMVGLLPLIFFISSIFMILFALPKIPIISNFQVSHRGLWQRLNLFFLYLPFLMVALGVISQNSKQQDY